MTNNCHLCGGNLEVYVDFGRMPIANGFLTEEEFEDEYFYNLAIGQCTDCLMVQLVDFVPPEKLFHDKYPFYSSSSEYMDKHFANWAYEIKGELAHYHNYPPLAVEIGCNDGAMLHNFVGAWSNHIGVEPAANVAEVARQRGCRVFPAFFNEETAAIIVSLDGKAQVIYGANVFPHIPDLHSVMRGIKKLLAHDGLVIIEEPYWHNVWQWCAFDQIYDEHYYYFALRSLKNLFGQYNFELVALKRVPVHGGSMRYTFMCKGAGVKGPYSLEVIGLVDDRETEVIQAAEHNGQNSFRQRVDDKVDELAGTIIDLVAEGKSVVGYGATSKSTTLLNYCALGPNHLSCIYDTTPDKIGKFSPGMHIRIRDHKYFAEDNPEYAVLFAWNHKKEIVAKERDWLSKGGKFIEYVPQVKVTRGN